MTHDLPWYSVGTNGSGGTDQNRNDAPNSSGAVRMKSRQARSAAGPTSAGSSGAKSITLGPTGYALNSNDVTTPKLPPPPFRPQSRSEFSVSLAIRSWPSA